MGDPSKPRKQYENPRKRWDKSRIESEKKIMETYGIKSKRELRKMETWLREKRTNARKLLALPLEKRLVREKETMSSISRLGLLKGNATLNDILGLTKEELLEKRLQTIAWRKNLATTIGQARQFIVHGHIAINGKKVTAPSYLVPLNDIDRISYYGKPMQIELPKSKKKEEIKKEFEEAAGEGSGKDAAEATAEAAGKEGVSKDG